MNSFETLIGNSDAIIKSKKLATRASRSNVPILLNGESGVGKEIFARAIHDESSRAKMPFIVINCGSIPKNLVESILFGHVKGAFTDAKEDHKGKFSDADGGTVFLDEIGELPIDLQVKLLRVLQNGDIEPIGAKNTVKVDVRIISATHKNLKILIADGLFREDLYYRLNVIPVDIPPLCERVGDVEILVKYFIQKFCNSEKCAFKKINDDALVLLNEYSWPGNVRQLENAVMRAVILADTDEISSADFPQITVEIDKINEKKTHHSRRRSDADVVIAKGFDDISIHDDNGDIYPIEHIEKAMIEYAYVKYNGKMTEICKRLGIGRSTLYRKATEMGLLDQ